MSDNRSQDDADLPWPVARGDLDDFETLELVRDATGRLAWQNIRPPAPETYRDWLPTRATKGTPPPPLPHDVADVGLDDPLAGLFDSEATSRVAREPLQPLDTPTASALEAASIPPWPAGVAAPRRLSMMIAASEGQRPLRISLPPAAPQTRSRAERLALLGTGALMGAMATIVLGVAWRPDERPTPVAADRSSPAPRAETHVPLAAPVAPDAQPATVEVAAAPPAAAEIVPTPTSPPVQVAAAVPSRRAEPPARRPARTSDTTATATRSARPSAPVATPPEILATIGRFATAYNRMDARATQAVWPTADRQALVTTFTALREQRLTLSRCRGALNGDTATVLCRGTLRYRPRVGNHDTRTLEGNWRFTMLQRADDWVVDGIESP